MYTRSEIDAFVDENLHIVGRQATVNADTIRRNFADAIEQLPPEQQTLLIETRRANITGDSEAIQGLYPTDRRINGFFNPGDLRGEFGVAQDPILWRTQSRGNDGIVTARHEQGHRADRQIGGGSEYWSDRSERWGSALQSELEHQAQTAVSLPDSRNPVSWISRQIRALSGRSSSLYEGARELPTHLELYDDVSDHPREAMAEISNHHMSLYAEYNGDEARVDATMSNKYPELWPVYRDDYLPAVREYAETLETQRQQAIDTYINQAEALALASDQNFNESEVRQQASILAAKGSIASETRTIQQTLKIYNDPTTQYISAQRDLAETRYYLETPYSERRNNPFSFDENAAEIEANNLITEQGRTALVEDIQALKAEGRALNRFETAQNWFSERVSTALGEERTVYKPESEILAEFDALKADGGLDAVTNEINRLTNLKGKPFTSFLQAREDLEYNRWEIENPSTIRRQANPFVFDRDAAIAGASNLVEGPNGKEALSSAAKEITREIHALDRFYMEYQDQRASLQNTDGVSIRQPEVNNFMSEQLGSANGSIQRLQNPALSESFANISEILTQPDYIGGGPGPHTSHQQNGFTLRDHLGSAIERMLQDGGLNREHFGGQQSWQRLRQEFHDLAGDDPRLIEAFQEFEVDLFEQAHKRHGRVTPLASSANPIRSREGSQILTDFDAQTSIITAAEPVNGGGHTIENIPDRMPDIGGSTAGIGLGLYGIISRGDQINSDLDAGGMQAAASSAGTAADVADVAISGAGLLDDAGRALNGASKLASRAAVPLAVASAAGEAVAGIAAGDAERATKAGVGLTGALAGGQAGAVACAAGGPWAAAGCGIIGGIAGGLIGEEAVEAAFNLPAYREEIMQQRWKDGGFEAVDMVIARTPVGEEASQAITSYNLREVSEAKTALLELLEMPIEERNADYPQAVESATEDLLQKAIEVVDPIITDNHADITLSEITRKLDQASEMTALISGRSVEEIESEATSIETLVNQHDPLSIASSEQNIIHQEPFDAVAGDRSLLEEAQFAGVNFDSTLIPQDQDIATPNDVEPTTPQA